MSLDLKCTVCWDIRVLWTDKKVDSPSIHSGRLALAFLPLRGDRSPFGAVEFPHNVSTAYRPDMFFVQECGC